MKTMWIAAFLCAACAEKDEGEEIMIEGTIKLHDHAFRGVVEGVRAFGYDEGDKMIAYISSNPKATCANVSEFLGPQSGEPLRPDKILKGGYCNITILVETGWDNGFDSHWPDDESNYSESLGSNVRCDMGEGDWVLETRGSEYEDWYWSGTTWGGPPENYNWSFSGGDGDPLKLDIRMTSYQGYFYSEAVYAVIPAEGQVEGEVTAEWCPSLANATIF